MDAVPYADIIFLAAIAVFIFYKLNSSFGKKDGTEERLKEKLERMAEEQQQKTASNKEKETVVHAKKPRRNAEPEPLITDSKMRIQIDKIKATDPNFTLSSFMGGAKAAFEMILEAYSHEERDVLKDLLSDDVFAAFDKEITAREKKGLDMDVTLIAMLSAELTGASVRANKAKLTVDFKTEQARIIKDTEGNIIEGNLSDIEVVEDSWVFERNLKSSNPNWMVVDTE